MAKIMAYRPAPPQESRDVYGVGEPGNTLEAAYSWLEGVISGAGNGRRAERVTSRSCARRPRCSMPIGCIASARNSRMCAPIVRGFSPGRHRTGGEARPLSSALPAWRARPRLRARAAPPTPPSQVAVDAGRAKRDGAAPVPWSRSRGRGSPLIVVAAGAARASAAHAEAMAQMRRRAAVEPHPCRARRGEGISGIAVVIHPDDRALYEAAVPPAARPLMSPPALGGDSRQASVPPRPRGAGGADARHRADP